ncbi:MAG: retropepsin-like aspartic protease [Anaerolineae bacterium]|nr:retropepsin-like aspartic protease [Anaerolineae bacterium]
MEMGLIIKPVEVIGDRDRVQVQALFDTEASASFLRRDIAESVATFSRWPAPWKFVLGDGKNTIEAQDFVGVHITIKGVTVFFPLLVVDQIGEEMIIGADMLQRWKIRLDPEKEEVFIDKKVTELKLMVA